MQGKRIRCLLIVLIILGMCGVVYFFDAMVVPLNLKCALAEQSKKPDTSKANANLEKGKHKLVTQKKEVKDGQLVKPFKNIDRERFLRTISAVLSQLEKNHVGKFDYNLLLEGTLNGMVKVLDKNGQVLSGHSASSNVTGKKIEAKILTPPSRSEIGYIRMEALTQEAPVELDNALKRLEKEKMRALILDLRNNPGGTLKAAVSIADKFISDGAIVTVKASNGKAVTYRAKKDKGDRTSIPLVVIINSGTASEAEVVAGALKERRAIILGARSAGKGWFQRDFLVEGTNLKLRLAVGEYQLPSGQSLNGKGIEPNIVIKGKVTGKPSTSDTYVKRAQQILKGILKFQEEHY